MGTWGLVGERGSWNDDKGSELYTMIDITLIGEEREERAFTKARFQLVRAGDITVPEGDIPSEDSFGDMGADGADAEGKGLDAGAEEGGALFGAGIEVGGERFFRGGEVERDDAVAGEFVHEGEFAFIVFEADGAAEVAGEIDGDGGIEVLVEEEELDIEDIAIGEHAALDREP